MNKLEKVALKRARRMGRPLVLVFNNVHFFQHTDEGRNMLLQLQQRAESWAESSELAINMFLLHDTIILKSYIGIMTMVFTSYVHIDTKVSEKPSINGVLAMTSGHML